MIVIDSGDRSEAGFEARLRLAGQLAALGHRTAIDADTAPPRLNGVLTYQAAPFLFDSNDLRPELVIVLVAETVSDATLAMLRRYRLGPEVRVVAVGGQPGRQAQIDCQLRLGYAIGRDAEMLWLARGWTAGTASGQPLFAGPLAANTTPRGRLRLTLVLSPDAIDDPLALPALAALSWHPAYRLRVVLPQPQREALRATHLSGLDILTPEELAPSTLAGLTDIAVFQGAVPPGDRMLAVALDLLRAGRPVVDATAGALLSGGGAPVLRGPEPVAALAAYLDDAIRPNLPEIARRVGSSPWIDQRSLDRLLSALGTEAPVAPAEQRPPRTVFLPTNGNGLGHAQRCLLVAEAMDAPRDAAFAAFPSCAPMIAARGFDCLPLVQRSDAHDDPHANDVLNYHRLNRSLQRGDRLIFDGGYVFNSVYRTIMEKDLSAVWIRRGLWQPAQVTPTALRREAVFAQVIVPGEAFDELNDAYTYGPQVTRVGPIVRQDKADPAATADRRDGLAARFGRRATTLVVTMLGGGVAADRAAQLHTICATLEGRPDCLHLVVVWPGSRVSPVLAGWTNSHAVQTRSALDLCRAADLVISASGYNSFHEILYHALPSILVPQMAPFMDDQDRRARAASDRGLAATVAATDLLSLEREIAACLDGGKAAAFRAALVACDLPEAGTAEAAALIGGMA